MSLELGATFLYLQYLFKKKTVKKLLALLKLLLYQIRSTATNGKYSW